MNGVQIYTYRHNMDASGCNSDLQFRPKMNSDWLWIVDNGSLVVILVI